MPQDNPANNLQKEIEYAERKKQALISATQNEMLAARQRVGRALAEIGQIVYDKLSRESAQYPIFAERFTEIEQLSRDIAEKESRINEISTRYDEAISILSSQLASAQKPSANVPRPQAPGGFPQHGAASMPMAPTPAKEWLCPQCGAGYSPDEDIFCVNCGCKLGGI